MMNPTQFIEEIAEILEANPASLSLETDFREEVEDWSSLMGFSILIFLQDRCGVNVAVNDFLKMNTIGDLYKATEKPKS